MAPGRSSYYPNGLSSNPSRLAIFVFYDKDGIVDDYVPYLLNDLKKNLTELVIVINGKITSDGRARLRSITPHLFVRENKGLDAAAWREAMIDYLGWNKIAEYDELILLNDTFFGPLYPFRDIFHEMDSRPVDFWGLIAHNEADGHGPLYPYGYLPQFIQSFFTVIRKKMTTSYEFKAYWENQPVYDSYEEAAMLHEAVFTKHFEDVGFVWDVYVDVLSSEQSRSACVDHNRYNQFWLLSECKFPIVKRKNFILPYYGVLDISDGNDCRKSLDYVMKESDYDCNLIFKHILRVYHYDDIYNSLHLNYILSKKIRPTLKKRSKAVIVFFIFYNKLDFLKPYICGIPEAVDVILLTNCDENCRNLYQYFSPYLGERLRVLSGENRGREMSALFITAAPYLKKYDYIGFCHDKGPHKGDPVTKSSSYQETIIENTIGSGPFIENVIELLDEHPEIGFLSPPLPCHSGYFIIYLNRNWTTCFEEVKLLAQKLNLKVEITEDQWCLAAGDAYWCRREALSPLFSYPWKLEDFPSEPIQQTDGTFLHAIERIFPFVAQQQGYLSGWVMTDEYASLEITNIRFWLDHIIHNPVASGLIKPETGVKGALIIYIKKHLPRPLWGIAKKIKHLLRW